VATPTQTIQATVGYVAGDAAEVQAARRSGKWQLDPDVRTASTWTQ